MSSREFSGVQKATHALAMVILIFWSLAEPIMPFPYDAFFNLVPSVGAVCVGVLATQGTRGYLRAGFLVALGIAFLSGLLTLARFM